MNYIYTCFITLCFVLIICLHSTRASDCPGATLTTQAEVDAFTPCDVIESDLIIDGASIYDISKLSSIKEIEGNFIITNTSLTSIVGFTSLRHIEGVLEISSNSLLKKVNGFNKLSTVGEDNIDDFIIADNGGLIKISGFESLKSIAGDFEIVNNDNLPNLNCFYALQSVGDAFEITDNDTLASIGGFPVLNHVEGAFMVGNSENLTYCCGLYNIFRHGVINGGAPDFTGNGPDCDEVSDILDNCGLSDCQPNCRDITTSLNDHGKVHLLVSDLLSNYEDCESGRIKVTIRDPHGKPLYGPWLIGDPEEIIFTACDFADQSIIIWLEGGGGNCYSRVYIKNSPRSLSVPGRVRDFWCYDPVVFDPVAYEEKFGAPKVYFPCSREGFLEATYVADWVVPYECYDISLSVPELKDTTKLVYREYEVFYKGWRASVFDTLVVYRLPLISVTEELSNAYCKVRDTIYCGKGKIGPQMIVPERGIPSLFGEDQDGDGSSCDTLCLLEYDEVAEMWKPRKFPDKCGLSMTLERYEFDYTCEQLYKYRLEVKQSCYSQQIEPCTDIFPEDNGFVYLPDGEMPGLTEPAYLVCEFWITDLDTAKPVVECKLDHFTENSFVPYNDDSQEDGHCFEDFIWYQPELFYDGTSVELECKRKDLIVIPTSSHECAAHITLPPVCAWDDWSGVKQVKARVYDYHTIRDLVLGNGFPELDKGTLEGFLDDLTNDEEFDEVLRAKNQRSVKSFYYQYRCDVSDYLEENLPEDGLGSYVFKDNEEICNDIIIWNEEESQCDTVEGDCYASENVIRLGHSEYPYVIVYEVIDECHNKYFDICYLLVKDKTRPIVAVDKGVTVTMSDKKVWVEAETFNEGSWDNCDINLMLARRTDWYEACIDPELELCWVGEHGDSIYQFALDTVKHKEDLNEEEMEDEHNIDPSVAVEAKYAHFLDWLCTENIPCGYLIYNAWLYDLLKYGTQKKDSTITDHYFRKLFDIAWKNYGFERDTLDNPRWEPLKAKAKHIEQYPGLGCEPSELVLDPVCISDDGSSADSICPLTDYESELIDQFEILGGGWSDEVLFLCSDVCKPVQVELLVMDYWCNWGKSWELVWVEDKTPINIPKDVFDTEISCKTYTEDRYHYPGDSSLVDLRYIVEKARQGEQEGFDLLDSILGGYCKAWKDPYGDHYIDANGDSIICDIDFLDYIDTCTTKVAKYKYYDDHHGWLWKKDTFDNCYYKDSLKTLQKGILEVNCAEDVHCKQQIWTEHNHCGQGIIYRKWKIWRGCPDTSYHDGGFSKQEVDTIFKTQRIWVGNDYLKKEGQSEEELEAHFYRYFHWPKDTAIEACVLKYNDAGNVTGVASPGLLGRAVYKYSDCRLVGIAYEDQVFKIVTEGDACYKILRTWYAQDWCGGKPTNELWWRNAKALTTFHEQKILVYDTQPPECSITGPVPDGGEISTETGCTYDFSALVRIGDTCGNNRLFWELIDIDKEETKFSEEILLKGTGIDSVDIDIDDLYAGNYKLKVLVFDNCENTGECTYFFSLRTGKKPSAVCATFLTARLNPMDRDQNGVVDTATVIVWASEFNRSSEPACEDESIEFRIDILDGIGDDTWEDDSTFAEFGCRHLPYQTVRLWVVSYPSLSADYCDVVLMLQSEYNCGNGDSGGDQKEINMITENRNPVGSVQNSLNNDSDQDIALKTRSTFPGSSIRSNSDYFLYQNRPNPFREETVIGFSLADDAEIMLQVFDVSGRAVKEIHGHYTTGYHELTVYGDQFGAGGVLYYRLKADQFIETKRMVLIR